MRRFFAPKENFRDRKIVLDADETRHLRDVLRLGAGARVSVFDGAGREFSGAVESVGKKETILEIIEETPPAAPESALGLTLAVALLKGEKFELVIQKAVELGAMRLLPVNTKRADVRLKDADKRLERWRRIALEASKQCGRARLMEILPPRDFSEAIERAEGAKILFAERGGASFESLEPDTKITAFSGPEGGWEDTEIEAARAAGVSIVTLGGRILRAETAVITIAALLQHRFGDLG
ncbi:MAG: 16S rRNA (uracil(1498)-N(3))-methyltransferase [Acidobacteria bacterium]|nr:16S rRNA (uracil(1498)-N(3))-methyltransferase [Acidobacteriota bacterium]